LGEVSANSGGRYLSIVCCAVIMAPRFKIIFDEVMLKQLKTLGKNQELKVRISKMLDKIEELGPRAGKLLDSRIRIYEVKSMKPPIRLYYKHVRNTDEIYVFEYEIKKSSKKQSMTIERLKEKSES
jgi:mRNA-degrading endonuclease RelE of RelBE toxin-antitoxin system